VLFYCSCSPVHCTSPRRPAPKAEPSRPVKNKRFFEVLSEQKRIKFQQFEEALQWRDEHKKGAKACLAANPHFDAKARLGGLLNRSPLNDRINGKVVR